MLAFLPTRLLAPLALVLGPLLVGAPAGAESYTTVPWRYGNWGGGGYSNGDEGGNVWGSVKPVDTLDSIFRDHDRGYATADGTEGEAYRKAFAKAAASAKSKYKVYTRGMLRAWARDDKAVSSAYKAWKNRYGKVDRAALGLALALSEYPSGKDPKSGKALPGTPWAAFAGSQKPSEGDRAQKRRSFVLATALGLLYDPSREKVEDEVLAGL